MTNPLPNNHAIKEALKWIAKEMEAGISFKRSELIERACVKFDLSPLETEYLFRVRKQDNVKD